MNQAFRTLVQQVMPADLRQIAALAAEHVETELIWIKKTVFRA
jgi:hypothetical protein